jgi:hypothetical protein
MPYIYLKYSYKYRISFATNYIFTICGKCVNLKTNREIKQVIQGGSIGYSINKKFYSLTFLRTQLEKTPINDKTPF